MSTLRLRTRAMLQAGKELKTSLTHPHSLSRGTIAKGYKDLKKKHGSKKTRKMFIQDGKFWKKDNKAKTSILGKKGV